MYVCLFEGFLLFFFFKQKTAYELRISDWSSDVCSSDLAGDENLDRVRITVEILIVDMLDQFGAGNHLALVVKQIAEQLVFLGGQLHRLAVQRHAPGPGVEPHRPSGPP